MKFAAAALLATTVSAECLTGMEIQKFADKDCKTLMKQADKSDWVIKPNVDQLKSINAKCTENVGSAAWTKPATAFKSEKFTCDTSAFTISVFPETGCKGEAKTLPITWGKCTEVKMTGEPMWVMYKGAVALQAVAAATLAFVGTQF